MAKSSMSGLLSKLGLATATAGALAAPVAATPASREATDDDVDGDVAAERDRGSQDEDAPIRRCLKTIDSARGVAFALSHMPPMAATELAATWALSADRGLRLSIANALGWRFRLVGDDVVIDHLSRDSDPTIRVAAVRAAWARRTTGGDDGVLDRLVDDPSHAVRSLALLASSR